jgi:hypothetical protein
MWNANFNRLIYRLHYFTTVCKSLCGTAFELGWYAKQLLCVNAHLDGSKIKTHRSVKCPFYNRENLLWFYVLK